MDSASRSADAEGQTEAVPEEVAEQQVTLKKTAFKPVEPVGYTAFNPAPFPKPDFSMARSTTKSQPAEL